MGGKFILLFFFALMAVAAQGQRLRHIDSLRQILDTLPEGKEKVFLLKEIAWAYKTSQPALAHRYAGQSLRAAQSLKYPGGIADAKHTIGMIAWHQGEYDKASRNFFEALSIRESLNDSLGLSRSYNNIGNVYFRQGAFDKAFYYYNLALEMRRHLKDSIGMAYSLNNIADVETERNRYNAALSKYRRALELTTTLKDLAGQAFTHERIGMLRMRQGKAGEAAAEFHLALGLGRQAQDANAVARNEARLGNAYLEMDSTARAVGLLRNALAASRKIDARELQADALELLSEAYARQGHYDSAFYFQKEHHRFYLSLMDAERERVMLSIQEQYESEKQRANLLESQRRASRNQKFLYIAVLIGLSLVALNIVIRYRFQIRLTQVLQEKNQEIAQQNESLLQSNRSLEQFAYVVSHDLREPLRTIGSFSSLLARRYQDKLDQNARDFIEYIVMGVGQMSQLLDGLLAFARLSGQQAMLREKTDLNNTLAQVLSALRSEIRQKNATIQLDFLPTLQAHPAQLHQLFQNLISNALKFNDKENPAIYIGYHKNGEGHHFFVQDNGIGINSRYFDKIFLIFQRLEKQQYSGTGIGLAICEKVVEQHRGRIWVESVEGKGSTFHFTLPDD